MTDLWDFISHPNESFATWFYRRKNLSLNEPVMSSSRRRCYTLLIATSRSFSRVIQELQQPLREAVMVFYLVLRGLDTIEDDMTLPSIRKAELLRSFHAQIPSYKSYWTELTARDRTLLENFDAVADEFLALSSDVQSVIQSATRIMGSAMADFVIQQTQNVTNNNNAINNEPISIKSSDHVDRINNADNTSLNSSCNGLATIEEYNRYCYYVAGLVGEGLTRLFSLLGTERETSILTENSVTMGLFLQKTNIIRDYREDFTERRIFWPRDVLIKYVDTYSDLLLPENHEKALHCLSELVCDALSHVPGCLYYLCSLEDRSIFNFCAIPQTMAIATLALVFRNINVFRRNVKISRGEAYLLIRRTTDKYSLCNIFLKYVRIIHRKNTPSDPNFLKISIACSKIEQWVENAFPSKEVSEMSIQKRFYVNSSDLLFTKETYYLFAISALFMSLITSIMIYTAYLFGARWNFSEISVVQIHWHDDTASIYSAHFEPCKKGRLATAGGDGNVRIWRVMHPEITKSTIQSPHLTYLSTLSKHTQAVNVVRFSPQGGRLASAGDDGYIFIWILSSNNNTHFKMNITYEDTTFDKETWKVLRCCRSTGAEIYDLAWSPDGLYFLTGSMDHIARIYNANEGQCIHQLTEHVHYIQGVAWDPLNAYVATTGSDRTVQIYRIEATTRLEITPYASSTRVELPNAIGSYHNETLLSFFRRLSFTPDGSLLLVPAGQYRRVNEQEETLHTVYIYTRAGLNRPPVAYVSGYKRPAIAVCCSPKYYTLRNVEETVKFSKTDLTTPLLSTEMSNITSDPASSITLDVSDGIISNLDASDTLASVPTIDNVSNNPLSGTLNTVLDDTGVNTSSAQAFSLLYRMIYAVATQDAVVLYDTQQINPICILSNLHYATLTDLAWSFDGDALLMTSTDGFCSIAMFDENELGEEYMGPCPSFHVEHASISKDALKGSADHPDTMTEIHSTKKSNVFLHNMEKKQTPAVMNIKEKKRFDFLKINSDLNHGYD
ncbi:hypothetical protein PCK1_001867 [Pneumocystis canis]|nr:hypothetical protein PCK1_001867 [Pneumocystis canis]